MVPLSWSWLDALLLAGDDEAGQHGQHGAVHRHRHRHLLEGDAVEEDLHVLDRVDRHAGLADVADDARVVGVVAPVGRQVEGDRHALLARRRGCAGRRRSTPRRWRTRRTGGSSTAGPCTSWRAPRARTAPPRGCVSACSTPSRSAAVYSGCTTMPSGVSHTSVSGSAPLRSLVASARQAWGLTGSVTGPRIGGSGGADEPPRDRHRLGRVVSIARCGAAVDLAPPLLVIARHEPAPRRTGLGCAGPPRRTARVPRQLGRGGERAGVRTGAVRPATGHGPCRRLLVQRLDVRLRFPLL